MPLEPPSPTAALRARVHEFYAALAEPNGDWIPALVSHQAPLLVGTAPEEWWDGYDNIFSQWSAQKAEFGGSFLVPGRLRIETRGNLGWVVDDPDFTVDGEPQGINVRLTMVFELVDGTWWLVHMHSSRGISNDILFTDE